MAIYKVIKKQIFITSRIIKADSEGDALDKFREVSADIDPVLEDPHFEEEIDVEEHNDYNEKDVDC